MTHVKKKRAAVITEFVIVTKTDAITVPVIRGTVELK
jgi:hypothetical protein